MNIIQKILSFIKKRFIKQEAIKTLEEPKNTIYEDRKNNFIESLKINHIKKSKKKVETLTCDGDGLGIQKKISF